MASPGSSWQVAAGACGSAWVLAWAFAWCLAARVAAGTPKHPPAISRAAIAAAANWRAGNNRTPVRFFDRTQEYPEMLGAIMANCARDGRFDTALGRDSSPRREIARGHGKEHSLRSSRPKAGSASIVRSSRPKAGSAWIKRTSGALSGRDPSRDKGSLSGPARAQAARASRNLSTCGDIEASFRRLTPRRLHRPARKARKPHPMTAGSHGGGRIVRPPRPYRYSDARSRLAIHLGRVVPAPSSGAATLIPRGSRSAARVLMDEGWVQCNAAPMDGDKFCGKSLSWLPLPGRDEITFRLLYAISPCGPACSPSP